jgi:hypothetical protein
MNARVLMPTAPIRALAWLVGLTLLAAVVAAVAPGLGEALRTWFAFKAGTRAAGTVHALGIWLANLRVLGLLVLAALAVRERQLRPALDAVVVLIIGANVALVGLALGAYGLPLLPSLAHVPLEWAGLAVGLAAYARARNHTPCLPDVAKAGVAGAGLLGLAASVEAWATPLALP